MSAETFGSTAPGAPLASTIDAADRPTAVAVLSAPATWRAIDFISDLHLADDTPRCFDAWAAYLETTSADAVFILGDLFEAWPGDDARTDAFEGACAEVLKKASARRHLAFMVGNRDFLVGHALLSECGVQALADPVVLNAFGQRALLSHGDAWCLADTDYLRLRAQVRSPAWKGQVLSQTLAQRRALARHLRERSDQQAATRRADEWADVDPTLALSWLRANDAPVLIHGHTHRPGREQLAAGHWREVLSDWDIDRHPSSPSPAPDRAEVLRWQVDGFHRIHPAAAGQPAPAVPIATREALGSGPRCSTG